MKKFVLLSVILCGVSFSWAQKTELSVGLGSNSYSFRRPSSTRPPILFYSTSSLGTFPSFYYGNNLGYGVSATIKRITKDNLIFGAAGGFENLRNKLQQSARLVYTADELTKITLPSDAFVYNLNSNFLFVSPFLGKRFTQKPISVDFTTGFEVGYFLNSYAGIYSAPIPDYLQASLESKSHFVKFDVRPKIEMDVLYKKIGVNFSFAQGVSNYLADYTNITSVTKRTYSRVMRVGISYQIL